MTPKQQLAQLEAEAKAYSESIDKQIGHEKHRRIKTAAYYGYLDAAKKYQGEIRAAECLREAIDNLASKHYQASRFLERILEVHHLGITPSIELLKEIKSFLDASNT